MVTHLYGILGVILDRTFGNIIRMLRVIRLPKEERAAMQSARPWIRVSSISPLPIW